VTINSGGEKIFAEEVESAMLSHPAVRDVVVSGRPSERWGQEVVAIVALVDGRDRRRAGAHRPCWRA
jgi:fatty-acyl-CoA synthase